MGRENNFLFRKSRKRICHTPWNHAVLQKIAIFVEITDTLPFATCAVMLSCFPLGYFLESYCLLVCLWTSQKGALRVLLK